MPAAGKQARRPAGAKKCRIQADSAFGNIASAEHVSVCVKHFLAVNGREIRRVPRQMRLDGGDEQLRVERGIERRHGAAQLQLLRRYAAQLQSLDQRPDV